MTAACSTGNNFRTSTLEYVLAVVLPKLGMRRSSGRCGTQQAPAASHDQQDVVVIGRDQAAVKQPCTGERSIPDRALEHSRITFLKAVAVILAKYIK